MNFIIDNWYLILLALASGAMLVFPLVKGGAGGTLSAANAVQLINREKAVVIDVGDPEEFAAGHVKAARNVPLNELQDRLPGIVKNKALPVILVCSKGPRALRAEGIAKKLGYPRAQALAGGLKAWREANLPVEKS